MVTALLLEARARDALGDQATAGRVLERALDITESSGILLPFLLDPAPALLERHRRYRTAHPGLDLPDPGPAARGRPGPRRRPAARRDGPAAAAWMNSSPTARPAILRYLPTHLTAPEIASELFLSVNTVSTHTRHLYAKLGVHSRHEAVDRARALGLPLRCPRRSPAAAGPPRPRPGRSAPRRR